MAMPIDSYFFAVYDKKANVVTIWREAEKVRSLDVQIQTGVSCQH